MAKNVDPKDPVEETDGGENDLPPTRKDILRLEKQVKDQSEEISRLKGERSSPAPSPEGKKKVAQPEKRRGLFSEDWDEDEVEDHGEEE